MAARVKIGLCLDDLSLPAPEAIGQAARMGYEMIEFGTVGTEFDPRRFGQTARRHLRQFVLGQNMAIAAVVVDIGGRRFADPARLEEAFDRVRLAIEMARQIHVPIVVVEPGPVAASDDDSGAREVLRSLGQVADATGTVIALQAGYTPPQYMADLLGSLGCAMIRVCYDPAALLINGFDPLASVEPLADQIVLSHVRDAIAGAAESTGRETPLGQGQIDVAEYLAHLHEAGYFGPQIVRRMHANDPVAELTAAAQLMRTVLA